jgi:ketoreductase
MTTSGKLTGRTAVVTGAGTGIGRAIALRLAADGAFVHCLGRRLANCEETVAGIEKGGGRGHATAVDVADRKRVDAVVAGLAAATPLLDILVHNAGKGDPTPLGPESDELWDEIVAANLTGIWNVTRAVVPHMPSGSQGRIVSISSVLGRFGVAGMAAYCAAKSGVIGLTRALALELAPRQITVNAVCPGWVETEMALFRMAKGAEAMGIDYEKFRRKALAAVPLGRILEPEEIAGLVAWLASDEASGMTGQSIGMNAGSHME